MVELLIVLAIIAILAAVAIPVYSSQLEASRKKVDESNLRAATGIAAQDYIVRNAGSTTSGSTQPKSYGVFVLEGQNQGDAKNMLVYPFGVGINSEGEEVSSSPAVTIPNALPSDLAGVQKTLGTVQSKTLKWYPVQQNSGKGTFDIQIGENGVVQKSEIKTFP